MVLNPSSPCASDATEASWRSATTSAAGEAILQHILVLENEKKELAAKVAQLEKEKESSLGYPHAPVSESVDAQDVSRPVSRCHSNAVRSFVDPSKDKSYFDRHGLLEWCRAQIQELEETQPDNPYHCIAKNVAAKVKTYEVLKLDEALLRLISDTLEGEGAEFGLSRYDALLVALHLASDIEADTAVQLPNRNNFAEILEDFHVPFSDALDDAELSRLLQEALAARSLPTKKPHLVLNFDVNQTVIMLDSIAGAKETHCCNEVLANHSWGRIHEGQWELVHPEPALQCPDPSLKNYEEFVVSTNPMPEDKKDRDAVQKVREARRKMKRSFTDAGQPGQSLKPVHQQMVDALRLPAGISGTPEAQAAGLEGSSVFLLPCFIHVLIELKRQGRSFTLLFRTYGLDLAKVQKELNALCEGKHPLYPDVRMDGSDGEADYRMHLESLTQSGTWYRENVGKASDGQEVIALIMGTVAQPSERPKKGDILGLPFYEHLKTQKQQALREARVGDRVGEFIKKISPAARALLSNSNDTANEVGIDIRLGEDAIDLATSFTEEKTIALRDFFPAWLAAGNKAWGGKPMFVDSAKLPEILPIFFDDNIGESEAKIVDIRSVAQYRRGMEEGRITFSKASGLFAVKAHPLQSIRELNYFLDKIHECEAKHQLLLERRAEFGELVYKMLSKPTSFWEELSRLLSRASQEQGIDNPWGHDIHSRVFGGAFASQSGSVSANDHRSPTASQSHSLRRGRSGRRNSNPAVADAEVFVDERERHGAVKVIGLTSSLACGREVVADVLRELGAIVIDCNKAMQETCLRGTKCYMEITNAFDKDGIDIVGEDLEIDQLMDVRISNDTSMSRKLQKIIWPHVAEVVNDMIYDLDEECEMGLHYTTDAWMTKRVVVVDSAVLFESPMHSLVDEVWYVSANAETQVWDLVNKKHFTEQEARCRVSELGCSQARKMATVEIHNESSENLETTLKERTIEEWRKLHLRMYGHEDKVDEPVIAVVNPEGVDIGAAPLIEVWDQSLWYRLSFVILRHRPTGGFYVIKRSVKKEYMPGRFDLSIFGRPRSAPVPTGVSPAQVGAQALQDKLGVSISPSALNHVTNFEYHGALPFRNGCKINFIGIVFEAFIDVPVNRFVCNDEEVEEVMISSANECQAMQQHEIVPMTAQAYDVYSSFFCSGQNISSNLAIACELSGPPEAVKAWRTQVAQRQHLFFLGLTGNEVSTRKQVASMLEQAGAAVIDCQLLASRCYKKGTECFKEITTTFGSFIVGEDGEVNMRLLMPILESRPEMLRRFQAIVQPHLFEAVQQRATNLEETIVEVLDQPVGCRHVTQKVVVIDHATLTSSGMVELVDEVWSVVNNWDDLTRKRVTFVPLNISHKSHHRVSRSFDSRTTSNVTGSILTVEIQVDSDGSLREDVVKEWRMLHLRMYCQANLAGSRRPSKGAETRRRNSNTRRLNPALTMPSKAFDKCGTEETDPSSLENEPILEVVGPSGQLVGAAHLRLIRQEALAHRIAFVVLRHGASQEFYIFRRSQTKSYMPGCLDLSLFGKPGSSEIRAGEPPQETAIRTVREKLGVQVPANPRLIGDFKYHGVLPWNDEAIVIFGVLFEIVLNVPVTELRPDPSEVEEVIIMKVSDIMSITKAKCVPMSSCFFKEYWVSQVSQGVMFRDSGPTSPSPSTSRFVSNS